MLAGSDLANALRVPATTGPVRVLVEGRDFDDVHDALGRSLALSSREAVLVRPDGHVAAIFRDLAPSDMSKAVAASLAVTLAGGLAS